jgi:hypothetical protein
MQLVAKFIFYPSSYSTDGSIINQYTLKNVGTKEYYFTACFNE